MLNGIFVAGPESRDFEVTFKPLSASIQQNDCRDLLIAYQGAPALETGRKVAERLRSVTDKRSGIGLMFLMTGQHGPLQRLVISRFPANQAILAEVAFSAAQAWGADQIFEQLRTSVLSYANDDEQTEDAE